MKGEGGPAPGAQMEFPEKVTKFLHWSGCNYTRGFQIDRQQFLCNGYQAVDISLTEYHCTVTSCVRHYIQKYWNNIFISNGTIYAFNMKPNIGQKIFAYPLRRHLCRILDLCSQFLEPPSLFIQSPPLLLKSVRHNKAFLVRQNFACWLLQVGRLMKSRNNVISKIGLVGI